MTEYKKKLIEVALPLDAINAESAREKSIRHGHPSTLHLWWARRPLAACRAVLFAQLVDDPSAHPEQFPTEEEQDAERERLFRIIEDLVKWENSRNEEVLEAARAEIRRSCGGEPPPILDPFAGGGSIPLEAQRLGLEAHASDLNPVAVLINKALIEIPQRWANHSPVHPEADNRTNWTGAQGLAEDVRRYGRWMRDEAERRIGHLYPRAALPDGSVADVVAWIWARTVTCPNPACGATMPLARSFWLGKKKGREAWIKPVVNGTQVRFEVGRGGSGPDVDGTVTRSGARCLVCGESVSFDHVRSEGRAGRMGAQLMATVSEGDRARVYLEPDVVQAEAAVMPRPASAPVSDLPQKALGFRVQAYGMTQHADLFTNRQLTALTTFSDLIGDARRRAETDAVAQGFRRDDAVAYAGGIATYLAFAISKLTDRHSTLTNWYFSRESTSSTFQRQALPMVWDFAETQPLSDGTGTYLNCVDWVAEVIDAVVPGASGGTVEQRDAAAPRGGSYCVATDPPYYDNIGYADLADYFYVWLRRSLEGVHKDLLTTMVTPKADELIASPYRHAGSKSAAEEFFRTGFVAVFRQCLADSVADVPMTVFYAFKQAEDAADDGVASTGWSTLLDGLAEAGWSVTGTWPMRTEASNRMVAAGTNALASSVVLACRPRPESAGVTDRQGFVRALQQELPGPLQELQKAHIAPVDLRQAAIGPGMAVYSRYARVIEPSGERMRIRTALGLINQALDEVLEEQQQAFDDETRWAINWFSQFYFDEGPYGTAEQLAVSMDVSISGLVGSGILESGGGKARLLTRSELSDRWDPLTDHRTPVWEATQHLVKRLESEGEASAARLLRRMRALGEPSQLLAYRLYTLCERTRPNLAGPFNALVASWPEIQRLAQAEDAPIVEFEQQRFDT